MPSPNYDAPKNISIIFDPSYNGVGVSNNNIVASANYFRSNQNDFGLMINMLTFIIQQYPTGCPQWLTFGISDWVRYYNYDPSQKPAKPGVNNKYTDGSAVSAYFLQYINRIYSGLMIYYANKDCREGNYADTLWPRLTGKTLDQLWSDMMKSG